MTLLVCLIKKSFYLGFAKKYDNLKHVLQLEIKLKSAFLKLTADLTHFNF